MNDFATTDAAGVLPDTSDHNPDIAEILRNQSGKILNAIIDIEEKVDQLAEAFGSRLQVFTQEKISLEFSSMSVFSEKSLLDEKAALTPLFSVHGDEDKLIACFRLHQDTARLLLTITLGGHDTPTNELGENELRPSELKLFALLIDYLMSGFFESIDVDANLGIPRKPVFVKNEDFAELAEGIELVSFIFEFSAEQKNGFLELLVPLEVFENDDSERAEKLAAEKAKEQDRIWSERLHQRVEEVLLPHSIEIGSSELPLASIASLEPGQRLDISFDMQSVRILDHSGFASFTGKINIEDNEITLQVTGARSEDGV